MKENGINNSHHHEEEDKVTDNITSLMTDMLA